MLQNYVCNFFRITGEELDNVWWEACFEEDLVYDGAGVSMGLQSIRLRQELARNNTDIYSFVAYLHMPLVPRVGCFSSNSAA